MNKRNLKILLRNMAGKKFFYALNLAGLVSGITAFLLIALWIRTELTFDAFQKETDRTYRVEYKLFEEDVLETHSAAAVPVIGPMLLNNYPVVEAYTRFTKTEGVLKYEDRFYNEKNMFFAQSSFFELFNFPLAIGENTKDILDVNKVVITESAAKRYFGNENPLGKALSLNGKEKYYVSAVVKDAPKKSHFNFDILLSYENLINRGQHFDTGWFGAQFYTYVRLSKGVSYKALESKIPEIVEKHLGDFMKRALFLSEFKLKPIRNIHLHSDLQNELQVNGNFKTVLYMGLIAILVLVIAFVNNINLSTANSIERASEVGVRKVLGALKNHLLSQFLTESFYLNALAFVLSLGLMILLLPQFRELTSSPIEVPLLFFPVGLVVTYFLSSIITGIIPATFLARIAPAKVLKGKGGSLTLSMIRFRNGLIVFQFAVSITLIVCTMLIGKQISFLQNQNLGVEIDRILVVQGPKSLGENYVAQFDAFRSEMLKNSSVKNITVSSNVPGEEVRYQPVYGKLVQGVNTEKKIRMIGIDSRFQETYDLRVLAGRNFTKDYKEKIDQVILNEKAVEYFGLGNAENAIGQKLSGGYNGDAMVIGVFNDYHQKSLREKPCPLIFSNRVNNSYYSIKVSSRQTKEVIASIKKLWNVRFPDNPLNYFFLDDYFNKQYQADVKFGTLFMVFACLAIFIACLGLLGLSAYATAQRSKEIGVHKVNGAQIYQVLFLLNKDFSKWVIIAFLIACPLAWYAMDLWLQGFAYRTSLSWWIFALAGILALGIALLTVSLQSWKAANRNPVEALRYE